jgi:NAD(P)-dependent dehydrogenase (short-subunit alcohol dehydrogenase family)
VLGAWRTTRALPPLLRAAPHARIVNVTIEGGSLASMGGGTSPYHVTKAGLDALTWTLAGQLRREGVLVNAI